ncbi:MAG: twin-arginine translocation signal domain-containing protein, partial [Candidatus Eisenbacteria bacterium]
MVRVMPPAAPERREEPGHARLRGVPPLEERMSESVVFPRRDFLKLLGLGVAATAAGCGKPPADKLIPYLVAPNDVIPGVPYWYATTCRECESGCGVLAKQREGRVIKLEGNPNHPVNHGGLCARGQAALQGLYDPDRVKTPMV